MLQKDLGLRFVRLGTLLQICTFAFAVAAFGFRSPVPILIVTATGLAEETPVDSDRGVERVFVTFENLGAAIDDPDRSVRIAVRGGNAISTLAFAGPRAGLERRVSDKRVDLELTRLERGHAFAIDFESTTDDYRGTIGHLSAVTIEKSGPAILVRLFPQVVVATAFLTVCAVIFLLLVFSEQCSAPWFRRNRSRVKVLGAPFFLLWLGVFSFWVGAEVGVLANTNRQDVLCDPVGTRSCVWARAKASH